MMSTGSKLAWMGPSCLATCRRATQPAHVLLLMADQFDAMQGMCHRQSIC